MSALLELYRDVTVGVAGLDLADVTAAHVNYVKTGIGLALVELFVRGTRASGSDSFGDHSKIVPAQAIRALAEVMKSDLCKRHTMASPLWPEIMLILRNTARNDDGEDVARVAAKEFFVRNPDLQEDGGPAALINE